MQLGCSRAEVAGPQELWDVRGAGLRVSNCLMPEAWLSLGMGYELLWMLKV